MPNFGDIPGPNLNGVGSTGQSPPVLSPGMSIDLFHNEAPATLPQASMSVAIQAPPDGGYAPLAFDVEFSGGSATDSLTYQGSMDNATWQTLQTSTNLGQDNYADTGKFAYYRVNLVSWTPSPSSQTVRVTVRM